MQDVYIKMTLQQQGLTAIYM